MKIGITEHGDAGLNFEWLGKLCKVNIIIRKYLTKNNENLLQELIENKKRIILHITCTGFGQTKLEPFTSNPYKVKEVILSLIERGFPIEQLVLRVDPIIPTVKGLWVAKSVFDLFKYTGIKRLRYSIIVMYPHVKSRFINNGLVLPFNAFKAPKNLMDNVKNFILDYAHYDFETCAEDLPKPVVCISYKDSKLLGIGNTNIKVSGFQRRGCLCLESKTELLSERKRCKANCLYCYWKD